MPPFDPKIWEDLPSTVTPLIAEALIDLEIRLSNYTDAEIAVVVAQLAAMIDPSELATALSAHTGQTRATNPHGIDTELDLIDTALAGKAALGHGHVIGDVTNLQSTLDNLIAANDAMVFQGAIDCSANPNYPAADRGHTYRVSVAGKIGGGSGPDVQIGDLLLCLTDGTAAGTHAAVGSSWTIAQANIDGAVTGPASVTDNHLAQFDGTTGKLLKGGLSLAAAVEPEAWTNVTYLNSWANLGAGYQGLRYRKHKHKMVEIQGIAIRAAGATGLSVFQLPVGYRPTAHVPCSATFGGLAGEAVVQSDGVVAPSVPTNLFSLNVMIGLD